MKKIYQSRRKAASEQIEKQFYCPQLWRLFYGLPQKDLTYCDPPAGIGFVKLAAVKPCRQFVTYNNTS